MAPLPPKWVLDSLRDGIVIPAHPLAVTNERRYNPIRTTALTRYYYSAGAGGVAVGVHTTQFLIHDIGLYEPVLRDVAEAIDECERKHGRRIVRIAGIRGNTKRAVEEAKLAYRLGYHIGMVDLSVLNGKSLDYLIEHVKKVSEEIPIFGFYLQIAVGGIKLPYSFWHKLVSEVENIVGIKIAPFNRYATIDVIRAIVDAERENEIALYTGNDDNIVFDLITPFKVISMKGEPKTIHIVGGLLGQWAVWTKKAVELHKRIREIVKSGSSIPREILTIGMQLTDANAAIFDAANDFRGCIPGIHEVLRRSGLMENNYTLDPNETLSPGQLEEIDRIYKAYPHLRDDDFVEQYREKWLRGEC